MGQNRNTQMRNNSRIQQNRGTFQSGLTRNQGEAPQDLRPGLEQGGQQCPPGQEPGVDPNTGAQICKPARANIAGNVPINDANGVIAPTNGSQPPGIKPKGY